MSATSPSLSTRGRLWLLGGWLRRRIEAARAGGQAERWIRDYRRLASWGDAEAQFQLGQSYSSGIGVVRNLPEAVVWLRRAAEQDHQVAQYALGMILLFGNRLVGKSAFFPDNFYSDPQASGGNDSLLFPAGLTVPPDAAEAAIWLKRAAESGYPNAMCQLALLYADGNGIEQDSAKAVTLLEAACGAGLPLGHFLYAQYLMNGQHGLTRDIPAAMDHLEIAANQGHLEATFQLGCLLVRPGIPRQDPVQAEHWLTAAGQRQHVEAMVQLARLYADGKQLPRDDYRAVMWFRKAATLGDAQAQLRLAVMYQKGRGVDQDAYEALHWYEKAGRQGVVHAQYAVAMMYRQGAGVVQNDVLAAEWFKKAVDGGDVRAMINLGLLEASGALGERNLAEADRLFSRAEAATHAPEILEQVRRYREMHRIGSSPVTVLAEAAAAQSRGT